MPARARGGPWALPRRRGPFGSPGSPRGFGIALLPVVLSVLVLVPTAAAIGPASHGSWVPTLANFRGGCSSLRASAPMFSLPTGVGSWNASGASQTCGKGAGGQDVKSVAQSTGSLMVIRPIHLGARAHGVAIGWNLSAAYNVSANHTGRPGRCPNQVNVTTANYSYTWVNTTSRVQDCLVMAMIEVTGTAFLKDRTTGAVIQGTSNWSGVEFISGIEVSDYSYSVTYSNSSFWAQNYTRGASYNTTWGGALAGTLTASPVWYLNGSFNRTHGYLLVASISVLVLAECLGFASSPALVTFDARAPGLSETLLPAVVY